MSKEFYGHSIGYELCIITSLYLSFFPIPIEWIFTQFNFDFCYLFFDVFKQWIIISFKRIKGLLIITYGIFKRIKELKDCLPSFKRIKGLLTIIFRIWDF